MYSFDEHDKEHQAILWERAQEIAENNRDFELSYEEEMFEEE